MANRRAVLGLLLSLTCPVAWAQNPAGGEFQINSYTTAKQVGPAVASDANGNFVVVWTSQYQDGSDNGIFGQRFSAAGLPQGSEFQVNSNGMGNQYRPRLASDATGNFVVVWESVGQDGSGFGVFGRRFNASGVPQGTDFQVNSYTTGSQFDTAVASSATGNFVVVWRSSGQDGCADCIFGQRFDASGIPQASEFRVNSYTAGGQFLPKVASDASGNFVVVWTSNGQDGSYFGVFGQRFHAFGLPLGSEFQVNSFTTGNQAFPAVASDATGNFVVVWQSNDQDGSGYGVFGQRFNASGVPQGAEFRASTNTFSTQRKPAVALDASANFVVTWESNLQDGSYFGVFGQRFSTSGIPQGGEFRVNSYTTDSQYGSAVTSGAGGNFVVVWTSNWQDGDLAGIFGQRFGDVIFKNGFQ